MGIFFQVSPLFGTIYDAIYLMAKALEKTQQHGSLMDSGVTLTEHVKNLDFAGFSRRIQSDSKGNALAKYVILDTDGKDGQLFPTHSLAVSSGLVQPLDGSIHFPGGDPPPADSSCWFEPNVVCIRGNVSSKYFLLSIYVTLRMFQVLDLVLILTAAL